MCDLAYVQSALCLLRLRALLQSSKEAQIHEEHAIVGARNEWQVKEEEIKRLTADNQRLQEFVRGMEAKIQQHRNELEMTKKHHDALLMEERLCVSAMQLGNETAEEQKRALIEENRSLEVMHDQDHRPHVCTQLEGDCSPPVSRQMVFFFCCLSLLHDVVLDDMCRCLFCDGTRAALRVGWIRSFQHCACLHHWVQFTLWSSWSGESWSDVGSFFLRLSDCFWTPHRAGAHNLFVGAGRDSTER